VGLAAAEDNGSGQVACRSRSEMFFWRILIFYIGSIFVAGTLIPFTDPKPSARRGEHRPSRPFTIVFQRIPKFGF